MTTDRRLGTKLPEWADQSRHGGMKFNVGTYAGIVKNNVDPMRLGRLHVWLPDGGGEEDDSNNWRWVTYASPFYGSTMQPNRTLENSYAQSENTYGMWLVPPDVGNEVLCTFINGDPGRGYWFACTTTTNLSHNMVPGASARFSDTVDKTTVASELVKASLARTDARSYLPMAEFNESKETNMTGGFLTNSIPVHEVQAETIINQGLDTDPVRGAISSSSMREAPSAVFGISTPGRASAEGDVLPRTRKGGHSFVMDDGSIDGKDQLLRLRTAGGHQILMNDTEQILYIANAAGTAWMEFGNNGSINMYGLGGFAVRTQGSLNLHSDKSVNIQGASVNIKATSSLALNASTLVAKSTSGMTLHSSQVGIGSTGAITISGSGTVGVGGGSQLVLQGAAIKINDGAVDLVSDPGEIQNNSLPDANRDPVTNLWNAAGGTLSTIATVAPTHEPYMRGTVAIPSRSVSLTAVKPVCADTPTAAGSRNIATTGGAGPFGDYIANNESGAASYNAFNRGSSPPRGTGSPRETIDLENMTIDEILAQRASMQPDPTKRLFAVGRYQLIPDTLVAAARRLNIPGTTKFSKTVQDNMFLNYLCQNKQPKIAAYLNGASVDDEAALLNACSATAGEWASIEDPLLTPPRGRYDGVGSNQAHGKTPATKEALKGQWAFIRQQGGNNVTTGSGGTLTDGSGNAVKTAGTDAGLTAAIGQTVTKQAPVEYMKRSDAPAPDIIINSSGTYGSANFVPGLSTAQIKALMIQIAFTNSDFSTDFRSSTRIGRYGVNSVILAEYEFIKPDYLRRNKLDAINVKMAWTGKNDIYSAEDFLASPAVQDIVMMKFIEDVYDRLTKSSPKGIDLGDSICVAAGMINVAYFFKDAKSIFGSDLSEMVRLAALWRKENVGTDSEDATPIQSYNQGRYAIDILSVGPATAPSAASAPAGDSLSGVEANSVLNFGTGSGDAAHYQDLGSEVKTAMELMAKDYLTKTGKKLTINSSYRSIEEQTSIYSAWQAAGGSPSNPKAGGYYMPSKPSTNSPHNRKVAFDLNPTDIAALRDLGLLTKYNFSYPFPANDPVHIQYNG